MNVRLFGDVHGKSNWLLRNLSHDRVNIQLGDLDIVDYSAYYHLSKDRFQVIGGNHDNYPKLEQLTNYLGDYGILPNTSDVFFVRGALSPNKAELVWGKDWWEEEELRFWPGHNCQIQYEEVKPRIVLSHDAPLAVVHAMHGDIISSRTTQLLQAMFVFHEPEY